jgi:hypothetical protein
MTRWCKTGVETSTFWKDVDGRVKPGHDDGGVQPYSNPASTRPKPSSSITT